MQNKKEENLFIKERVETRSHQAQALQPVNILKEKLLTSQALYPSESKVLVDGSKLVLQEISQYYSIY
jgi:hypothetical protein